MLKTVHPIKNHPTDTAPKQKKIGLKLIRNNKTGQEYRLIRTGRDTHGQLLEMEVTYRAHSEAPPAHYHPYQTEHFTVLAGEMTVRTGGQLRILKEGDILHIPPNTVHAMWNDREKPAVLRWIVAPALQSEQLFETMAELSNRGKTNGQGRQGILQMALTLNHFSREFRLAKPAFFIQKIVFGLFSLVARALGYKASYATE